ncbi:MAG TPA: hypothetical protein VKY74_19255 [Chloroflexia bacterium]|nr:hypothetical protein [Chloroflexia bacterium]
MAQRIWDFSLEDGPHTVEMNHNYWTTRRQIVVDGHPLGKDEVHRQGVYGFGSQDTFPIGRHQASLHVVSNGFAYRYDLAVDGVSLTTGQPAIPRPLPSWAWAFIIACAVIPILTLGGAVPAMIGVGGAFGCANLARDSSKPVGTRVALCSGVVLLCWTLFVIFALTLASIQRP